MKYSGFFDRIKSWVIENNTTIEALLRGATDRRITASVYHGWKQRDKLPSGEFCYDIAHYMGVTTDWLISGEDPVANMSKWTGLIKKLESLPTSALEILMVQIDAVTKIGKIETDKEEFNSKDSS